jgi:hypothetical protein
MTPLKQHIRDLEESGAVEPGRIQKLAASAFKLEIGKWPHPLEALKEMVGIKKPIMERVMGYVREGFEAAKPRAGLAAAAAAAALGVAAATKLYNEVKFQAAISTFHGDPEIMADFDKAESIAHMVKRWAPSIAADPQILKGTVKSLMKFPDSYLTYDIAGKLSETEKRYSATHGIFSILKERVL